jgi:methoxymalonate biosynthesis acyl carrier protein
MTTSSVRERIAAFLAPRLRGEPIGDEDDIFALGYVNSLFAVQLLRFVEREFRLTLGPEDVEFANFRTLAAMVRLVEAKTVVAG